MAYAKDYALVEEVKRRAIPLGPGEGYDALVEDVADSRIVMLGESTHGSEEFYEWRRRITSRLIAEHGFSCVAVEGDWPACWRLNQYVTGRWKSGIRQAFGGFHRWPTWMWANESVLKFVEWLHARNSRVPDIDQRAGFYGLDVYSLFESIDAVLKTLYQVDRTLVPKAKAMYSCLKAYGKNEKAYAKALVEFPDGCEVQVTDALKSLLRLRLETDAKDENEVFNIEQNAHAVKNAELYYRTMIHGNEDSWNVRDRHMLDTLSRILDHHGPSSKVVVWAHNQHVGDYRGCSMHEQGQVSLGGLAREKWGKDAVSLVGFGTYQGETIAAHSWGGDPEKIRIPAARSDSYGAIFHSVARDLDDDCFYVPLQDAQTGVLGKVTCAQRSIGVVYYPEYEHFGNYVDTLLAKRYDAFVHVDVTTAIGRLAQTIESKDLPEAFPSGT